MVRPKASHRIKSIAMSFVHVMTKPESGNASNESVSIRDQFGRKSLHSGMVQCLGHLARSGDIFTNREVEAAQSAKVMHNPKMIQTSCVHRESARWS